MAQFHVLIIPGDPISLLRNCDVGMVLVAPSQIAADGFINSNPTLCGRDPVITPLALVRDL